MIYFYLLKFNSQNDIHISRTSNSYSNTLQKNMLSNLWCKKIKLIMFYFLI